MPYGEAVANRRVLLSSTESREGLAQQVWEQSLVKKQRWSILLEVKDRWSSEGLRELQQSDLYLWHVRLRFDRGPEALAIDT